MFLSTSVRVSVRVYDRYNQPETETEGSQTNQAKLSFARLSWRRDRLPGFIRRRTSSVPPSWIQILAEQMICPNCGNSANRMVTNRCTNGRYCDRCAISIHPHFMAYMRWSIQDIDWLKSIGIDPQTECDPSHIVGSLSEVYVGPKEEHWLQEPCDP